MNEREQFEAKHQPEEYFIYNDGYDEYKLREECEFSHRAATAQRLADYNALWVGFQSGRQSSAAELAKRKASYEELARLHSRLIAELAAAQAKVAELSTHPCLLEDGNLDHDWKFVDDSFDHEFGTETVYYYKCKCCNATTDCEGDDE